jgi:tRNA nucleotidyltransferase (CCA-adding enzyme)
MPARTDDLVPRLRSLPGAGPVVEALAAEPGIWAVGGAVRDLLLERAPREVDLVVVGDAVAAARRAADRLGGEIVAHERFGTATVRAAGAQADLASARRERYAHPGALPEVELGATLEEDLARRDFSVNAIAVELARGRPAAADGALADLAARRLRVLHERSFLDDPTRLLRLARYAARLGFSAERGTARLAAAAVRDGALATVTGPRLGAELRLLAAEPQPAALQALAEHGLGAAVLAPGFAVDPTLVERALASCPLDARDDLLALAAACVGIGRGELAARLDVLGWPATERDVVVVAASRARTLARELAEPARAAPSRLWALLRREPAEAVALAGALAAGAGKEGEVAASRAERWLRELRHVRLEIGGDDLLAAGVSGPPVGTALEAALAAALDGHAPDRDAQLAAALAAVGKG